MSIIYVNINNISAGNGSSWSNAYNDLSTALDNAVSGDQLWVARGTYVPTLCYDVSLGTQVPCVSPPRQATFFIPSGVQVYGGFKGTETALSQRNFKKNVTILSGNLGGGNRVYHVVFFNGAANTTQLDGFTITDGSANGPGPSDNDGGAIFNRGSAVTSSPIIKNCQLINNFSSDLGGAVYNEISAAPASPVFENCVFSNNSSNNFGGAVYNLATVNGLLEAVFENCVFSGNSSDIGGAVYNFTGSGADGVYTFENCVFSENNARVNIGAVDNVVFDPNSVGLHNFINVTFFNNFAPPGQGMIMETFGTAAVATITNSILWNDGALLSADLLTGNGTYSVTYSDIAGEPLYPGIGNINEDPLFINRANPIGPDGIWATNDDGLALQPCSPCVEAGTSSSTPPPPTTDIIGNPRPTPPSMGAYEFPLFSIDPALSNAACNSNSGTLTVTGINNESIIWQSSVNGVSWTNTDNTGLTLTYNNLTQTTFYRVRVTTTDCPDDPLYSQTAEVVVGDCGVAFEPTEVMSTNMIADWFINITRYVVKMDLT